MNDVCNNVTCESNVVVGDFNELRSNINNLSAGDIYNVDKDYEFRSNSSSIASGIDIRVDNITINGNDHVLDGKHKSNFFKVFGNNVKIYNLTFVNGKDDLLNVKATESIFDISSPFVNIIKDVLLNVKATEGIYDVSSPIEWFGDGGVVSDCQFVNNTKWGHGGVFTWHGNYGLINNSYFMENVATGVGGAIYVKGNNVRINDSVFFKSRSQLTDEAVYLDYASKNTTISDCVSFNRLLVNGTLTGIDVSVLKNHFNSKVGDKVVDLVPLIYKSIYCGYGYYDNDLTYYINKDDKGSITFTMLRNFAENKIVYQKDYLFGKCSYNDDTI